MTEMTFESAMPRLAVQIGDSCLELVASCALQPLNSRPAAVALGRASGASSESFRIPEPLSNFFCICASKADKKRSLLCIVSHPS